VSNYFLTVRRKCEKVKGMVEKENNLFYDKERNIRRVTV
jgi:hypothetical protein